ncbi:sulfatase [Vibrio hannami]|uniref:sulfatase n=1 Tax=Vibrio hannami TaxID=2717094 RepID=UPI002410483F|nr:sulfatase [Vibrio hannami]MDG3085358.1 sulfatase [Vibrio hannami]
MKAVVVMFDTLTKNFISTYGGDAITPNFSRLAEKTVQFNRFYIGSAPCMPARREMHTGRYNFLHRSWGPIEPFDFSMPEFLSKNCVHTHLVTDHKHYWRDGGATYHTRYSTCEFVRGQEGDRWKGHVEKPKVEYTGNEEQAVIDRRVRRIEQDFINRNYMQEEHQHTLARTMSAGLEFIHKNAKQDNWFLQLECFDPHEPFFVPDKYLKMYGCTQSDFDGWMYYNANTDSPEKQRLIRIFYKALITMCDDYLGKVLDTFDEHSLWEDTLLIVNTDHGFLLGEHEWWGKNIMPVYNEIANIPFYIYDPVSRRQGEQCEALAQTIDIPATLMDFFGHDVPKVMEGRPITKYLRADEKIRDYALFGYFGAHINVTDGESVYMRAPREKENSQFEYTLMPTAIDSRFSVKQLRKAELVRGFDFCQGCNLLKVPSEINYTNAYRFWDKLYNVDADPTQMTPLFNWNKELELAEKIVGLMKSNDAPTELLSRYSLEDVSKEQLQYERMSYEEYSASRFSRFQLQHSCVAEGLELLCVLEGNDSDIYDSICCELKYLDKQVAAKDVFDIARGLFSGELLKKAIYQLNMVMRYE